VKQIKIDATESTNDYLKQMMRQIPLEDGTVVRTLNQTKGRGQRAADWYFEPDKSLALSVLKLWSVDIQPSPFHLQWVICCAVLEALSDLGKAAWHIKWPNDIMADGQKVAGLLIEHQFKGLMQSTVIGVGINVNNTQMPNLPHAASIGQILGRAINLEELYQQMAQRVYRACHDLDIKQEPQDLARFNQHLFLKNTTAQFQDKNQNVFEGRVERVNQNGQLLLQTDQGLKSFDVGAIKLLLDFA
jgi:BirA family biotin operon repressor/biotin-[acetyl-CoA-carboxylase] ligase